MFTEEFLKYTPAGVSVLDRLMARYKEPVDSRFYHVWGHIEYGLSVYNRLFPTTPLPRVKLFAWGWHDSTYDSKQSDNEQRSANNLMHEAPALGMTMDESDEAGRYILSTNPSAEPISVINDIDLAVLGSEPFVYDAYVTSVREEYRWAEDALWKKGRTAVLRQMLKRDRLYITPEFENEFTLQAIENLSRELTSLI